ncbi:MAG: response regulator transcription factor [Chloroflexi bacterium]|nr:response regulator transcription factor [Chloroflexota bacterium]
MSASASRVLIVDDEPLVREALESILITCGYQVRIAADGASALRVAADEQPEVVLLDLVLPGLDGVAVCRHLRSTRKLQILVLSALTDESRKIEALDAGADDYINKPFSPDELLARVRSALRRAHIPSPSGGLIRAGGVVLDSLACRVWVDEFEVHLTATEYDLLRVLVTNEGRVLTHRFLLSEALGPAYASAREYLRTYINQLRRKIEVDPRRPRRIITEPGIGYRFHTSGNNPWPASLR